MKGYKKFQKRIYLFDVTIFTRKFDLSHFRYVIVHCNARVAWREFKYLVPLALKKRYGIDASKMFFNGCEVFDLDGNKINTLYKIN